ncbi:MAG: hypothetical protein IKW00_08900 [Clostridia bacterium]|nr:hypothetical protein [Clostridia bacterium]
MNGIEDFKKRLQARMLSAVTSCVQRTLQSAKQLAPYGDGSDGGHLRDCIFGSAEEKEGFVSGSVYADNPHAAYVEHGTSRMPPRPYLHPAFKAQKAFFTQKLNH